METTKTITSYEQIKTYKDACIVLNIDCDDNLHPILKIRNIAKATNLLINTDKFPNWKDNKQYKHYPYFYLESGDRVFVSVYCFPSSASRTVIAYFKSESASNYIGNQFKELYIAIIEEEL